jgi:DNA-binding transcriptional LysR family regulator
MRAAEAGMGVAVLPDFVFRERQPSGTLVPILRSSCQPIAESMRSTRIDAIFPPRFALLSIILTQWFKAAH